MILLTLAGWTSIPLFLRHFADDEHAMDPWTVNGWRYGVSALLWAPVLVLGLLRRNLPKGLWQAALVPSIFNTIAQVAFAIAPYMVKPGLMTFSMRLQIIFLTVGAALMFHAERRVIKTAGYLCGMTMVMGGTAATLLLQPGGMGGTAWGIVISIGAGLFYAAYGLSVRKSMQGFHPFTAFAAVSQYTAAAIVVLMLIYGTDHGTTAWHRPWHEFNLLMLSAVIGIGVGHTLYFASISRLGLAVSAGVVQLQPITVSIGSYFLFEEKLTVLQWMGGMVAIGGAVLMLVAQHRLSRRDGVLAGETPRADAVLCSFCGNDLEGVEDGSVCPECGKSACTTMHGGVEPVGAARAERNA